MNLLHPVAAHKEKLVEQKIERAASVVVAQIITAKHAFQEQASTIIGRKPDQLSWGGFQRKVGEVVVEKLAAHGIQDWVFDPDASTEASQALGGQGYGNYGTKVWKSELTVVFNHAPIAPIAEVHYLQQTETAAAAMLQRPAA